MPCILHIETSNDVCSVAVSRGGDCLFNREDAGGHNHSSRIGGFVSEAVNYLDCRDIALDAVAVSGGPGSYTGLRIGVSMAKGLCFGRDLPLVAVPTLELLCVPVLLGDDIDEGALLCPMIDARRMEVYSAVYDCSLREVRPTSADVVTADTYAELLSLSTVLFFGNGAAKCREVITHPNARFIDGLSPLARWMMPIAEKRLMKEETEDVAYYTPFYLKNFAAKPARDMLHPSTTPRQTTTQ